MKRTKWFDEVGSSHNSPVNSGGGGDPLDLSALESLARDALRNSGVLLTEDQLSRLLVRSRETAQEVMRLR